MPVKMAVAMKLAPLKPTCVILNFERDQVVSLMYRLVVGQLTVVTT